MEGFTFHRKDLAAFYWEGLQAHGVTNFRSGLFLTAPRRTGKSTFLREDFIPHVSSKGGLPVIVDLWERPEIDMVSILTEALRREFDQHANFLARAAKKTGMSKVSLSGKNVSADFDTTKPDNASASLTTLIAQLRARSKKTVVLIIDEAQHALQTEAGKIGMFALKAARDALNLGIKETGLFLVFTGSNRDKLAELVTRKSQPFYSSEIVKFPVLDRDFVTAYAEHIKSVSNGEEFGSAALLKAFELLGKKPDSLFRVVSETLNAKTRDKDHTLVLLAQKELDTTVEKINDKVSALPETQRIVLKSLLNSSGRFAPFSADTIATYGCRKNGKKMTVPGIQKALDALRDKGFLWRGSYGDYAVDDDSLQDWHKNAEEEVGEKS